MVNADVVAASTTDTVGAASPMEREKFTFWPDVLVNVIVTCGSSFAAVLFWSMQVAVRPPSGDSVSPTGAPAALSVTAMPWANVCLLPDTYAPCSRKRIGILPFSEPLLAVATSLPAARLPDDPAPTALLPSTAPALRAKLTAAIDVPAAANTSAMMDTTSDGEGRRNMFKAPPR